MSELFKKVRDFVEEEFGPDKMEHFDKTVYWVKQLKPDADEAMLIAAIAHDISRAVYRKEHNELLKKYNFNDPEFLYFHQEKGAEIIEQFLKSEGADESLIRKVKFLIMQHEWGGNEDQNILKDADSISFFEVNAPGFFQRHPEMGKEKIRAKFDWMFERISSEKARQIAEPMYRKAIEELD